MERYIKCNNCNELIAVQSEYMVLCPSCNKRLDNSYQEWQKQHPDSTYAQYLSEVTISQTAISGLSDQRRITQRIDSVKRTKWLGKALGFAFGITLALIALFYLVQNSGKGASIKSILKENWKINYYADLEATISFPYMLGLTGETLADSTLVADSTLTILNSTTRSWSRNEVAIVTATRVEFAPAFGIDREGATNEILHAIIQENQMQAFEYTPSDYSMGQGGKARMISGSYLIGATPFAFRAIMIVRGDKVWYFMATYPRSLPEGTLLAEKFFNGILL